MASAPNVGQAFQPDFVDQWPCSWVVRLESLTYAKA